MFKRFIYDKLCLEPGVGVDNDGAGGSSNVGSGSGDSSAVASPASGGATVAGSAQGGGSSGAGESKEVTKPEPVKEVTFDLDALKRGDDLKDVVLKPEGKTTATPPPAKVDEKKPTETKTVEEKAKPVALSPFASPAELLKSLSAITPAVTGSREDVIKDLGIPEADRAHLSKMSNEAFNYVAGQLRTLKELQTKVPAYEQQISQLKSSTPQLPPSWYEHPEAYKLTPGYTKITESQNMLRSEYNHWQEQLVKIKAGEDWTDLEQQADGNIVPVTRKATTRDEILVQSWMNNTGQLLNQRQAEIGGFAEQFKGFHNQLRQAVGQQETAMFPDYNEKHPVWPVVTEAFSYLTRNGLGDDILAPLLAKMYGRLTEYKTTLETMQGQLTAKAALVEDVRRAGPTSTQTTTVAGGGNNNRNKEDVMLSLDMFKK